MDFIVDNIVGILFLVILGLLSMLAASNADLKEKGKENWELIEENNNLKDKIDDLKDEKQFLKDIVMEFKDGEYTKGELIKCVQSLIDKDKEEAEKE